VDWTSYGRTRAKELLYGLNGIELLQPSFMILDRTDQNPGAQVLFSLACVVVIVFGLQFAAPILLPSALALFLAVLSLPMMVWLRKHRVPKASAIILPVIFNVAVVVLLILVASSSVSELQRELPTYINTLQQLQVAWMESFEARTDIIASDWVDTDLIMNPSAILGFAGGAVGWLTRLLSMTFLVFLIMAFMLSEAAVFPAKFQYLTGRNGLEEDRLSKVVTEVQTYLGIKTVISLTTGLILGSWAYVMGLDFPVLLGLAAFLLNYVPTVGSIIAAIPAVLLSVILVGTISHAFLVAVGYVVVNLVFGNIIEPNLLGRRLGLSTLVVILSLLFWGFIWGPLGALLSVPLTVILKIWLENTPDLRWVAILLDKNPPLVADVTADAGD
jgi:predicted PurR-regulated permease PerM